MKRGTAAAVGLVLALGAVAVVMGTQRQRANEREESQFVREFPDALVLKAFDLYHAGDVKGAVAAWEEYIRVAPQGADTTSVRELIREARSVDSERPAR